MMNFKPILAIWLSLPSVRSVPIDNGIVGDPFIECGSQGLMIDAQTRNPFGGNIYVKGLYSEPDCRAPGDRRTAQARIMLPFGLCGLQRSRSITPRGIFVRVAIVISFHEQFVTKIDRAYSIQCFYMEADKTVQTEIEVSMLSTVMQTEQVLMPVCTYQILDGPQGQPVNFAVIGQSVYHKWTCDTFTVDTYCMNVHHCFVDDGEGDSLDLIDPNGCGLDPYLLNHLDYQSDLMAGQESHVFKYADRNALYFQCQISITIKEPLQECPRPTCDPLVDRLTGQRIRRHSQQQTVIYGSNNQSTLFYYYRSREIEKTDYLEPEPGEICLEQNATDILMFASCISALLLLIVTTRTVSQAQTLTDLCLDE